ncbi:MULTISPECIES: YolD-like family protein [unclassified Lysinibacillus]|uniref:YolD-like family protein n=1 Tax=unclassified Lysinibacillus TaxID=2636778 RepID=UPI0025564B12|nr:MULTISPECIES: YolD-like family protein [unclassified Lysinibacillus]MDM5248735.1 YolD-like family protein [Lysinibacillus sp. G4S2]
MIQDRGNIKWASMMLPEHLELLREFKQEHTEQRRELTEWELEELQKTIDQAFNQQLDIKLEVWKDYKITQWTGIIKSMNTNELILETLLKTKSIPIQSIQSAQLDADYYD